MTQKPSNSSSWRDALSDVASEEVDRVSLSSKHSVWLCDAPAVWGAHAVFRFPSSGAMALVCIATDRMVAASVGKGKGSRLYVCGEHHWERLSVTQMGPGLDWVNRKSWDVRCREHELWEVARTGTLPANRRVMGALSMMPAKVSGWETMMEEI